MTAERLLALTLYREAGNQCFAGKVAVAQVIMQRVADPRWPDLIEEVILHPKQFSCWNGVDPKSVEEPALIKEWFDCKNIARLCIDGSITGDGFNHYFNPKLCNPSWAQAMKRHVVIGDHVFGEL